MRQVGARDYQFDIDTGIATYLPNEGRPLEVAAVDAAVEDAGFQLLWLELELRGTLFGPQTVVGGEQLIFSVTGTGQRFLIQPGATAEEQETYARLSPWSDHPDRPIILSGRVHGHSSAPPAMTVKRFRLP